MKNGEWKVQNEKRKPETSLPPEQQAMNAEHNPDDRHASPTPLPGAQEKPSPQFCYEDTPGPATTFTYYFFEEQPRRFDSVHDKAKGVFVLTRPDGTVERFRDKPTRYLVVEPDRDSSELRPAVKCGLPVYLYLCREDKEL
jgi:hypothetical protein